MRECASGLDRETRMAKDKEKPAASTEEAAPKKGKGKLLVIIIAAVVLLAGGGGAAWYFLKAKKSDPAEEAKHEKPELPPVFARLETFTVNLTAAEGEEHYLQTDVELKVADPKVVEAIKAHMPEIRSSLLLLLSSKTAPVMATADGKKKLSKEIVRQINEILHAKEGEGVSDAYFTTFVVQ